MNACTRHKTCAGLLVREGSPTTHRKGGWETHRDRRREIKIGTLNVRWREIQRAGPERKVQREEGIEKCRKKEE